jgi:hypothetical protein
MLSTKPNYSSNPLLIQAANNAIARRIDLERSDPCLMAQRAGIVPDAWQSDLLRSDAKQLILNCSRQSGKSTISAVLGLHTAIYQENALVLLLSPSLRQSSELFKKLRNLYNEIESPSSAQVMEESATRIEFNNGSRVVCLPGSEQTVRGFSAVSLLVIDEASRVEDALYQSVRPMLGVSDGRIVLLSTPFGKRGFFHSEWTDGKDWRKVKITANECPRINKVWLERERAMIGDWWYRQEYLCEFVETSDSVFNFSDIHAAISDEVEPLF